MPGLADIFWVAALTFLFTVVYAVVVSIALGIRDNYLRYYQKAELQWTGPRGRTIRPRVRLLWVVLAGFITAVLVLIWFS